MSKELIRPGGPMITKIRTEELRVGHVVILEGHAKRIVGIERLRSPEVCDDVEPFARVEYERGPPEWVYPRMYKFILTKETP